MVIVDVTETLNAPAAAIFEILTDHAQYHRFPGIAESEMAKLGSEHPNGTGGQRRIKFKDGTELWEDITDYQAGESYAYKIAKIRPPLIKHKGGRTTVTATATGCQVHWVSEFKFTVPVLALVVEPVLKKRFDGAFRKMLSVAERLAVAA